MNTTMANAVNGASEKTAMNSKSNEAATALTPANKANSRMSWRERVANGISNSAKANVTCHNHEAAAPTRCGNWPCAADH